MISFLLTAAGREKMEDSKGAVLAVTKNGAQIGMQIAFNMPSLKLYLPERLKTKSTLHNDDTIFFDNWRKIVGELFHECSYLIFITAVGIAVRSISPHLQNKYKDPGVIVIDEQGKYCISLISGHLGGANKLAENAAGIIGGSAVITTATDNCGKKFTPDILASYMDGFCEPLELVKKFNRLAVEKEIIYIYSPYPLAEMVKNEYRWQEWPQNLKSSNFLKPAIAIAPYRFNFRGEKLLFIKPRCLIVGIGCRRGVSLEAVKKAVEETFMLYGLDKSCIKALATINFKTEEPSLKAYSAKLGVSLVGCTKEEIAALSGTYSSSYRVRKELGVDGICEPTAVIAAKKGITLVPKIKYGQVTVSVALEKSWWLGLDPATENF